MGPAFGIDQLKMSLYLTKKSLRSPIFLNDTQIAMDKLGDVPERDGGYQFTGGTIAYGCVILKGR
jgi:hypothetical protein